MADVHILSITLVVALFGLVSIKCAEIVTVLDTRLTQFNPYLQSMLSPPRTQNMSLILSEENDTLQTFESVCEEINKGASVLLDISSPDVGPLLRSFARARGLVFMTIMDDSLVLPQDFADEFFIQIQPPGAAMLKIVADIIKFDNLTNIAILYDDSFNVHNIPRRIISGVLCHHIYQQIDTSRMKDQLENIKLLQIENVFVIASSSTVDVVLGEANGYLPTDDINWFVVTKDAEITCMRCFSSMQVVVADGAHTFDPMNDYVNYMKDALMQYTFSISRLKVDEAFAYDLQRIFRDKLPATEQSVEENGCYGNENITDQMLQRNVMIMNNFRSIYHEGVFGPIVSDGGRFIRQKINMQLRRDVYNKGQREGFISLGNWTEERGLKVTTQSLVRGKNRKKYKVVVIPDYEPFIYKEKANRNGTQENFVYTGLCKDLFDAIAKRLEFDYELYETEDGFFGSLNDDGTWNGAIHELIEKKADIAIGPISVMSERENVVDFTVPFHEPVGLTILMKKSKFEYTLHRFLSVLEPQVWGCIVASYFLFSILMWLFDKFSPFSYQNNPDRNSGPEKRIFTLKEGIWFCMTSLTPQGGGEAPKAVSGRLVAATWWLYGFLLVAFYTANLAAFLTVTRLETPITSLDDLSKQQSVKYGPVNGTSALVYFNRMKEIEEQFYLIWKDMSLNDSLSAVARAKLAVWDYPVSEQFTKLMSRMYVPNSSREAMDMVRRGEFALIDDRSRNRYQVLTDCNVEEIGEEFSRKPFAFAVTQGSPLRAQMSNVILELSNNRVLEDLTNKWWDSNEEKIECDRIEDESDGISIENIGGVFLVIAIGTGMSLIAFAVEYYYYKLKPLKEDRLYSMRGDTRLSRIQSEVSLDHIQIGEKASCAPDGSSKQPRGHSLQNMCSTQARDRSDRSANLLPSKRASRRSNKSKKLSAKSNDLANGTHSPRSNVYDPYVGTNGHVLNGITNSIFSFDTDECMSEKYPDLHDPDRQTELFSEKL